MEAPGVVSIFTWLFREQLEAVIVHPGPVLTAVKYMEYPALLPLGEVHREASGVDRWRGKALGDQRAGGGWQLRGAGNRDDLVLLPTSVDDIARLL
jgi:hypothetical protein